MGKPKNTPQKNEVNEATRLLFRDLFGEDTQEVVKELLEYEGSFSKDPKIDKLFQDMKKTARKTFTS